MVHTLLLFLRKGDVTNMTDLPIEELAQLQREWRISQLKGLIKEERNPEVKELFRIELELVEDMDDQKWLELTQKNHEEIEAKTSEKLKESYEKNIPSFLTKWLQDETVRIWKERTGKTKPKKSTEDFLGDLDV